MHDDDPDRIDKLWDSIHGDLVRRGVDAATAADIAQETWLIATRSPPPDRSRLRGWLRVVANRLLQRVRQRETRRAWQERLAASVRPSYHEGNPAERAEREWSQLRRYVEELSEPYRVTLLLRFFEGRTVEEIAAIRSVPAATVRTHLKRGLSKLRARIGDGRETREGTWSLWFAWWSRARPRVGWAGAAVAAAALTWLLWTSAAKLRRAPDSFVALADAPELVAGEVALPPSPTPSPESRVDAALAVARPNRPLVTGIVRTPHGDPIQGAIVHSESTSGVRTESTVVTDAHGRYSIEAAGGLLWASHADWCSSARAYVESIFVRDAFDIVLAPTRGRAEVRVRSADGTAVDGAIVLIDPDRKHTQAGTLRGHLEISPVPPRATTDRDGRAALVFPDVHLVDVIAIAPERPFWSATIPTPSAGGLLEITLPAPSAIQGVCTDAAGAPVLDARVELVQRKGLVHRETSTDAYGAFHIDGLAQGEFSLRVTEHSPACRSARFDGVLEASGETRLDLRLDQSPSFVGRLLDGRVPVVGATVELGFTNSHAAEGRARSTVTDEHGRFFFGGCRPTIAYEIQFTLPGEVEPCFGFRQLKAGRGESDFVVPSWMNERAPIELSLVGDPQTVPQLLEVRSWQAATSTVIARAPDAQHFISAPLSGGLYDIVGWRPDLGAWKLAKIEHTPRAPRTHELTLARPGTLRVTLDLPRGSRPRDAEATLVTESFDRHLLGTLESFDARRPLRWNDAERAFVAEVPAGMHTLLVRGRGLSESHHTLLIQPGATHSVSCALERGVETTLDFRMTMPPEPGRRASRGLFPHDTLLVDVLTPTGITKLELTAKDQRMTERGFEFCVWLPESTVELRAQVKAHESRQKERPPWNGVRKVKVGELDAPSEARPRLAVELGDAR